MTKITPINTSSFFIHTASLDPDAPAQSVILTNRDDWEANTLERNLEQYWAWNLWRSGIAEYEADGPAVFISF